MTISMSDESSMLWVFEVIHDAMSETREVEEAESKRVHGREKERVSPNPCSDFHAQKLQTDRK